MQFFGELQWFSAWILSFPTVKLDSKPKQKIFENEWNPWNRGIFHSQYIKISRNFSRNWKNSRDWMGNTFYGKFSRILEWEFSSPSPNTHLFSIKICGMNYNFVRNTTNFAITVPSSILAFYPALHVYLTIIPRYFGPFLWLFGPQLVWKRRQVILKWEWDLSDSIFWRIFWCIF